MVELLSNAARAIWEACRDAEKLAAALILCGVVEAAAALWLIIFKQPAGILHHGKALFWLYYGVLIAVLLYGFLQTWIGVWVAGDVPNRRVVGKTAMVVSVLPLVVALASEASVLPSRRTNTV